MRPSRRGLRGDGVRQVTGRRAPDRIEAEDLRVRQRNRDHAILEAQRGQADGVILDVEIARADALGEPGRAQQRRPSRGSRRDVVVGHGQQGLIAPHAAGPLGNGLAGKGVAGSLEIALDLERREAFVADGKRRVVIPLATFPTSQFIGVRHETLDSESSGGPQRRFPPMGTNARARVTNSATTFGTTELLGFSEMRYSCTPNLMFPDPFPELGES